jgi:magnesium chelatase subunit H
LTFWYRHALLRIQNVSNPAGPARACLQELGATWASRNAYSYGRGERGTARQDVLQALLATTERIVQQVDSVEYGLTDIQEYYANTGALKAAAQAARPGRKVGCTVVEAFSNGKPRELEEVLRLEYRSKLLNPKWATAMAAQVSDLFHIATVHSADACHWQAEL